MVAAIAAKLKLEYSPQLNNKADPMAHTATEPTTELIRVLDPCAGRGSAALFFTRLLCQHSQGYYQTAPPAQLNGPLPWPQNASLNLGLSHSQAEPFAPGRVELYGIELEAHRARLAAQNFTYFLHTNALTATVAEQSFDLAFVNPPYDDSGDSDRRLEYTFLKRVTHTLKPGGVLVYIIPQTRLGIVAEYLAHYYTQVELYRFADPEFGAFRQVVVLAVKKGQGQGRSKNRNQGHLPPLKATEPDHQQVEDGSLKLELTGNTPIWTVAQLREAAEIAYTGWLPILEGAPGTEKALARQLEELRLPRYDEVEAELRQLRRTLDHQLEERLSPGFEQPRNKVEPSYLVPCSRWNEANPELAFYAGEYHREIALAEAQTRGVWSSQSVSGRALRQLVGATPGPVAMQSAQSSAENNLNKTRIKANGNSNSTAMVRPLTPLRQGQAALLIAIGLLNNLVLEDEQGRKVLVKGRTFKEYRTTKVEEDEAGNQTTTAREVVHSQVVTLDLTDGTLKELEQKELTPFLARFQKSIRRQMLRTYPPRYVPGQQDPLTQKLELGLRQLRRKPLGGQALAIVAAALALKQQGYATLSAEQGSGKSFMGAAAAYLGGASRIVVVCPPHLVNKWVREVQQTIRGGVAEVVRNSTELGQALKRIAQFEKHYTAFTNSAPVVSLNPTNKAKAAARPTRPPYFIILSRETTKLATRWQPGVVYRPAGLALIDGVMLTAPQTLSAPVRAEANSNQTTPENEEEEEETALSATDWVACCPRCGNAVLDNEGQPLPPKALAAKKRRCEALVRKWERTTRSWQNQVCGEPLWQQTATPIGTNPPFGFGISQLQVQVKDTRLSINSSGLKVSPKPGLPPRQGPRRMALAKYIQRQLPAGYFDLLILDEMHEYKGQGTAQGINAGRLVQACRGRVLALTGTLSGGKASDLFFLLWRTSPAFRREYQLDELERFIAHYGIYERITYRSGGRNYAGNNGAETGVQAYGEEDSVVEDGAMSDRRTLARERYIEKPGLNPSLLLKLMGHTVFLKLADVARDLPPYTEQVIKLALAGGDVANNEHPTQAGQYAQLESSLVSAVKEALLKGSTRLLGAMLHSLLAWPDNPSWAEEVRDPKTGLVIASTQALPAQTLYPKEQELIKLYHQEKRRGRRILLFVSNTRSRGIVARLTTLLTKTGARVAYLDSEKVAASEREGWVARQVKAGLDVLLCQPRSVQTGLDLLDFPTLVFYQLEYSTYVLRQASRRSWRIGQTQPVTVYHFIYQNTMQEQGLTLIAKKILASQLLEGELDTTGVAGLAQPQGAGGPGEEGAEADTFFVELARQLTRLAPTSASRPTHTQTPSPAQQTDKLTGTRAGMVEINLEHKAALLPAEARSDLTNLPEEAKSNEGEEEGESLEAVLHALSQQEQAAARFIVESESADDNEVEAVLAQLYHAWENDQTPPATPTTRPSNTSPAWTTSKLTDQSVTVGTTPATDLFSTLPVTNHQSFSPHAHSNTQDSETQAEGTSTASTVEAALSPAVKAKVTFEELRAQLLAERARRKNTRPAQSHTTDQPQQLNLFD
jgi:superfamily II DNA or RNA helicase